MMDARGRVSAQRVPRASTAQPNLAEEASAATGVEARGVRELLAQVLSHCVGTVADLAYCALQFVRRHAELLRPVLKLVFFVDVNAVPVRASRLAFVVCHASPHKG